MSNSNVAMKASDLAQALMENPDCQVGVMVHGRVQAVSGLGMSGDPGSPVMAIFFADFIPPDANCEPPGEGSDES